MQEERRVGDETKHKTTFYNNNNNSNNIKECKSTFSYDDTVLGILEKSCVIKNK